MEIITIISIITNILMFGAGVKYFIEGNKKEIKKLSDNASSYFIGYAFSAMIILLLAIWVKSSSEGADTSGFQNVCFAINVLIWVVLGAITVWFEALENVPRQLKSKHFLLYIISLLGSIYNSIFAVAPDKRGYSGIITFILFGLGVAFIYILGMLVYFLIKTLASSKIKMCKEGISDEMMQYFMMFGIIYPLWQLAQIYITIQYI